MLNLILQVSGKLAQQTQEVKSIVETVTTWVTLIVGLVSLISLVLIFTSDGDGEAKIKKAGVWLFLLIFMAIGFALTKLLF